MTKNETKSLNETELEIEKKTVKEAEASVLLTLYLGLFLGMIPVIGFPVIIPEMGGKILFIGITMGIVAFISVFFIGTLFGIPKQNMGTEPHFSFNNSLVEISDWLTKIIVGVGLIYLRDIPGYIGSLAEFIRTASNYNGQLMNVYTIGIVIYFGFLGLFIGYNYMRLVLANKYMYSNDNLIRRELEIAKEKMLALSENNQQKENKLIQILNAVHEKENFAKNVIGKLNEPLLSNANSNTVIKKLVTAEASKKETQSLALQIDKMLDEAKLKLHKGLIVHNDNPQKGQWGSNSVSNERELMATIIEETKGLYKVRLQVVSTNPKNNPLKKDDLILFALSNMFEEHPFKIVKAEKQSAELHFYCCDAFTVGAFADNGTTELELDLSELPNAPTYFKHKWF